MKPDKHIVKYLVMKRDFVAARHYAGGFTLVYRSILSQCGISERTERRHIRNATNYVAAVVELARDNERKKAKRLAAKRSVKSTK